MSSSPGAISTTRVSNSVGRCGLLPLVVALAAISTTTASNSVGSSWHPLLAGARCRLRLPSRPRGSVTRCAVVSCWCLSSSPGAISPTRVGNLIGSRRHPSFAGACRRLPVPSRPQRSVFRSVSRASVVAGACGRSRTSGDHERQRFRDCRESLTLVVILRP